jgi:hypothetical protein
LKSLRRSCFAQRGGLRRGGLRLNVPVGALGAGCWMSGVGRRMTPRRISDAPNMQLMMPRGTVVVAGPPPPPLAHHQPRRTRAPRRTAARPASCRCSHVGRSGTAWSPACRSRCENAVVFRALGFSNPKTLTRKTPQPHAGQGAGMLPHLTPFSWPHPSPSTSSSPQHPPAPHPTPYRPLWYSQFSRTPAKVRGCC